MRDRSASPERTQVGASDRWTEEEVSKLSEWDTRVLMQMATVRSTPHDLFIIRWCTAHLRNLHRKGSDWSWGPPIENSDGRES
jgi:hypothetical protein